jgi:hypothetical protein
MTIHTDSDLSYRPHKDLLPILRDWLADPLRLGALGRVTAVDGFDPKLQEEKKARQEARTKKKGIKSDSPAKQSRSEKMREDAAKRPGMVGKTVGRAEALREQAMEAVGKDESKGRGKSGAPRMAMARSGSSMSSIGSGVLGPNRRGSVSSEEIEGVLREAGGADAGGGKSETKDA